MNKKEQPTWISVLKLLGNIISWTLLTLLILVAGFLLYYVITTQIYSIKGEKYAPKFSLYTIISPSMTPNINVYDIVINKKITENETLKVGDVITFVSTSSISNGMTITHRIVDIIETEEGIKYKTQGDANLTPDSTLVARDKIIGKVKLRLPQLGRIQFFLSSKGGWLFIILIPAIVIVALDILKLFKIINIKQKVHKIEVDAEEEENETQAQLVAKHKKQQALKNELKNKANRNKFRRNKFESANFFIDDEPVEIKVEKKETQKENQEVISTNDIEASNEINTNEINFDNDIEITLDNLFNEIEQNNQENTFEIPEIETDNIVDNKIDEDIKSKLAAIADEDDELELPMKVELKKQEIPDDVDLPTLSKDK